MLPVKQSKAQFMCQTFRQSDCFVCVEMTVQLVALILCLGPLAFGLIFINTHYFGFKADGVVLAIVCEIYATVFILAVVYELHRIFKQLLDASNDHSLRAVVFSNCHNPSFFIANFVVLVFIMCLYGVYVSNKVAVAAYYFPQEMTPKKIADYAVVMTLVEMLYVPALVLVCGIIACRLAQTCKLMCTKAKEYDEHATLEQIKHVV
jgi:hypothetical protein